MLEKIKQSILAGSAVHDNRNINQQFGIRLKTTWKWLNCLRYNWKEIEKSVFFDGHKCKHVVEYRKSFLDEIKSHLLYLVDISEDGSML